MLVGHRLERDKISTLVQAGALGPAHIFSGIEGVGKKLVALETAKKLLCQGEGPEPCQSCKECVLISKGNHPDVILVDARDTERWNLEGIRTLLHTLGLKPYQGHARIVVFNDADDLSAQAVNSLLKSIEEPRPGTYFFVIAQNSNGLLPTLRSRCQTWFFKPLRAVDVGKILNDSKFDELRANLSGVPLEHITSIASGSMVVLEDIAASFDFWEQCVEDLETILQGDLFRVSTVVETLKGNKELLRMALRFYRTFAYRQLRESQDVPLVRTWSHWISELVECEHFIFHRNVNPAYALHMLLLGLTRRSIKENLDHAA